MAWHTSKDKKNQPTPNKNPNQPAVKQVEKKEPVQRREETRMERATQSI